MSRKHKKFFTTLYYTEHFLILGSEIIGGVLMSAFASLIGIPIAVTISPVRLQNCTITAGNKN